MTDLVSKRCLRHSQREAVVLCPACKHYFCRECIIEHQGLFLCSRCLNAATGGSKKGRGMSGVIGSLLASAAGFLFLWMSFFYLGKLLLAIPSSFHEGTLWSSF